MGPWADFSAETGPVRRELHSSGYAPMIEDVADTSRDVKALNFHSVRTHDLARINEGQRVVDAHFIFPLPHLDASDPSNYYFEPTDYLLGLSRDIGLQIFYRLGTSIEHSGATHFNARIPEDIDKSVICREQDEETRRKLQQITVALIAGAALIVLLLIAATAALILRSQRGSASEPTETQLSEEWLTANRGGMVLKTTAVDEAPPAPRRRR